MNEIEKILYSLINNKNIIEIDRVKTIFKKYKKNGFISYKDQYYILILNEKY